MEVDSKIVKSHSNIEIENEVDEVLCEFDVILNNSLEDTLKLLQFPLIPSDKQYNNKKLNKITKNEYYYEFEYQTSFKNIDNESSKYNFNRLNSQNTNFLDQSVKFSMKGEKIYPNTNYCVAIVKDNNLYLNYLSDIIQLRSIPATLNTNISNKNENKLELIEISRIINKLTSKNSKTSQNVGFNNINSVKHFNKMNNAVLDDEKDKNSKITIIPFSEDSKESKSLMQNLHTVKNIDKKNDNSKPINEEDYYNFLYDGITQITVAEQLYEFATNTKTLKDLDNMKLKEKIEYYFSKCAVIQFERLITLCMYKKLTNFTDSTFAKGVIDEFSKQMINNITFYCKFIAENILCLKTELSIQDEKERKKVYILLKKLNEKKFSKNDLSHLGISNLNKMLETYSEFDNGIYFLKGNSSFKKEEDKLEKNIIMSSLIDYTKLSVEEIEQIIRVKVKLGLASKIENDLNYFNDLA
jgi:hypothetical protein